MIELYPHQQKAINFCSNKRFSYLAIPCGGGKTLTALEATKDHKEILIICPAALCQLWADEIQKWYDLDENEICVPVKSNSPIPSRTKYTIVSYDKAMRAKMYETLFKRNYSAVIVDEAHKIKNPKAKRTLALLGWQGNKKRLLTKDSVEKCLLLSGTPMMQRPSELYSILRGLVPEVMGPYKRSDMYGIYFCKAYKDVYGRWIQNGADHLDELALMTKDLIYPVSKEEIEKSLPPLRKQIVRLACAEQYVKQEQQYSLESVKNVESSIGFEGLSELRHMMAIQKIPYIEDFVKDLLLSGEKVILFAWHRVVINSIFNYLEEFLKNDSTARKVLLLDGSVPPSMRQSYAKRFNEENYAIAVCQISSIAEGVSLHTANHVVFSEISWNPSENEQALKRVHRKGQENKVLAHYLVVKNSLDDKILKNVLTKEEVVSKFNSELINF